jgi:hypothetical protein
MLVESVNDFTILQTEQMFCKSTLSSLSEFFHQIITASSSQPPPGRGMVGSASVYYPGGNHDHINTHPIPCAKRLFVSLVDDCCVALCAESAGAAHRRQ